MIEVNKEFYKEFRCSGCRKLLAYEYVFNGRILIKCPYCNEFNKVKYSTPKSIVDKIMAEDEKNYNPDEELILKRKVAISDLKGGETE